MNFPRPRAGFCCLSLSNLGFVLECSYIMELDGSFEKQRLLPFPTEFVSMIDFGVLHPQSQLRPSRASW